MRVCVLLMAALCGCDSLTGIDHFQDGLTPGADGGAGGEASAGGNGGTLRPEGGGGQGGQGGDGGCPLTSAPCKRVFVTDATFEGDFGGLAVADDHCAGEAAANGLGGDDWVAWLSAGSETAVARLEDVDGGWCLVDDTEVAHCQTELVSGKLLASIMLSPSGAWYGEPAAVWTGTQQDGSAAGSDCNGWTAADGEGVIGSTDQPGVGWTASASTICTASLARLYCFEQAAPPAQ